MTTFFTVDRKGTLAVGDDLSLEAAPNSLAKACESQEAFSETGRSFPDYPFMSRKAAHSVDGGMSLDSCQ